MKCVLTPLMGIVVSLFLQAAPTEGQDVGPQHCRSNRLKSS